MKKRVKMDLVARAVANIPNSFNKEQRSVDFILSTGDPVRVFDYDSWSIIRESLVPEGMQLPEGRKQVPLLDTHDNSSVQNILGSVRNIRQDGNGIPGTVVFATDDESERAMNLVEEGHLTDGSVGYQILEYRNVKEGEMFEHLGRTYTGPQRVVTKWLLKEFSLAPIGADVGAKARNENFSLEEKSNMEENVTNQPEAQTRSNAEPEVQSKPAVDVENIRKEAEKEVLQRVSTIQNECRALGFSEIEEAEFIALGNVDSARSAMIKKMAAKSKPVNQRNVEMFEDESVKFRKAATDGLLLRAGVKVKNTAAGAESLRLGFKALARECVERSGISTRALSDEKIFELALHRTIPFQGTSDFSYILLDASNKAVMAGYDAIPSTFEQFCKIGSVSDFKAHNRARLSDSPDLAKVGQGGELQRKSFSDAGASVAAETYGAVFGITRQALINDDLSLFNDIPMMIGARARQQINAFAYALLAANKLSDGTTACFSSDNGNLATLSAAPSAASLSAARLAMMSQTDISGTKLNMAPAFIIAGPQQADNVFIMMNSEYLPGNENARSPYFNLARPIIDANITGKEWYLAASPIYPTIEIVFLNGVQTPTIEELPPTEILGMTMRAFIDYGGSVLDYRGMYKNAGA